MVAGGEFEVVQQMIVGRGEKEEVVKWMGERIGLVDMDGEEEEGE